MTTGESCAVNVKFKPEYPGAVSGAVQVVSESGTVLATTPILGMGAGPQIGPPLTTVGGGFDGSLSPASPIVVDGAENTFGFSGTYSTILVESPSNGGPQIITPFTYNGGFINLGGYANSLAIDGAGNIFFTANYTVGMITPDGATTKTLPFQTLNRAEAVAVDGIGDVFVDDNGDRVLKLPAGCQSSACEVTVSDNYSVSEIAADLAGDLFVSPSNTSDPVIEYPANGGAPISLSGTLRPNAIDGMGNFFQIALDSFIPYVEELPVGMKTPQILIYLGDEYECGGYAMTLDRAGNSYGSYSCPSFGGWTYAGYLRSQFAPLNFGSTPVGSSLTLPLQITNIGNRPLSFKPYFQSASYKILSTSPSNCESATAPGATCTLNIQFTALTVGDHTITLTLSGNAAMDGILLMEGMGTK